MAEEITIRSGAHKVCGHFYPGEGAGARPLVILCHGFNSNMEDTEPYCAKLAAGGISSYAFDFCGGGEEIRSEGSLHEMSVLTERADLLAVIAVLRDRADVDADRIFLMGQSQGGYVSLLAAAEPGVCVRGLILCYPAWNLRDYAEMAFGRHRRIKETYPFLDARVGLRYIEDALPIDILGCAEECAQPVLILHGTKDQVVPYALSEKAAGRMPDAELVLVEGAGHGFYGGDEEQAAEAMARFVLEHC